ncbi:MAG: DNA translocase FtsK [bacterium]
MDKSKDNNKASISKPLSKEVLGFLMIAFAILLLISFISYDQNDTSFNAKGTDQIHNYVGKVGSYTADAFIQIFGIPSYLLPIFILIFGWNMFWYREIRHKPLNILGIATFFTAFCSLLSLYSKKITINRIIFSPSGGIWGDFLANRILVTYFNKLGSYLIIIIIIVLSIIFVTKFSLSHLFKVLIGYLFLFSSHIKTNINALIQHRKEKKKELKKNKQKKGALTLIKNVFGSKRNKEMEISKKRNNKNGMNEIIIDNELDNKHEDISIFKGNNNQSDPNMIELDIETEGKYVQQEFEFIEQKKGYQFPPLSLLDSPKPIKKDETMKELIANSGVLEAKLRDFGVEGKVVQVHPGPVITRYEYEPAPGIKINKIANLSDDLALAMKAFSVRIVAPIPGKAVVGVEIPNRHRETVYLKEILASEDFQGAHSRLSLALGKDIAGLPFIADLAKMPHLLVAGATGSGKSVLINTIVCSILFKSQPNEVKFIMVDPKRLELGMYEGIPHLLTPVVTEPQKAANALTWAIQEMERRYKTLAERGVRNVAQYNKLMETIKEEGTSPLPYIFIVIDEYADLMMLAPKPVEFAITRLAQMARAIGIHLLIATQRPSVDVITGLIKANFPARLSFRVSSKVDSRTILDANGAEKLLGMGDMLYLPPETSRLKRVHGCFVTETEIIKLVEFLKKQGKPEYNNSVLQPPVAEGQSNEEEDEYDDLYDQAVEIVTRTGQASISMLQRKLRVGYNRAARMIELMEKDGVVGPSDGIKARKVLVKPTYDEILAEAGK